MSRMKHLLRKLHIGGEARPVINSDPSPPSSSASSSSSSSSAAAAAAMAGRIGGAVVDPVTERAMVGISQENSGGGCGTATDADATAVDFNFMEEEFQVQLALAISVSDPSPKREDTESVQIKAAKRMSLGYSPSVAAAAAVDSETLVEFLSLRYWNYNFVNYDEKIMDGFYDVYEIPSNAISQGKMPLLADLQAISVMDKVNYEVVFVNRSIDHELQQLEESASRISLEGQVFEQSNLIQKIADLVVDRMGGAVGDADEMWKRWSFRSYELRTSLNTIVLPLGCLDIGLSRHRALLFKVLADRINLPCMLVKGSYYTGTDEGAVNLIKFDDGSEYIIDLMGAPGTLIPPETPCSHLPNSGLDKTSFATAMETPNDSTLILEVGTGASGITPDLGNLSKIGCSRAEEDSCLSIQTEPVNRNITKKRETEKFEHEFGKLLPVLPQLHEGSPGTCEKPSSAQKIKVKDVSKYVISAAKNPEFAQKLHAVLLESGASPPADLFSDINFQDMGRQNVLNQVNFVEGRNADDGAYSHVDKILSNHEQSLIPSTPTGLLFLNNNDYDSKQKRSVEEPIVEQNNLERNKTYPESLAHSDTTSEGYVMVSGGFNETIQTDGTSVMVSVNSFKMATGAPNVDQNHISCLPSAADSCQREPDIALVADDQQYFQHRNERILNNIDTDRGYAASLMETSNNSLLTYCNAHNERTSPINPLLGDDVAEWEILWEDLQIGERIGIGSYGEVYHADWNGTEVAVKKFLVQDFSGDTLDQFKCEIEIMLRLRHPNVVLFMGAVARPPNLSILTEFIPRGSLYRLLHRPNHHLDEKRRMRMALDVAKGMNYLHTSHPPIVHRDLKSPNLLVDKNWVVKVCDFGLSRLKHHTFLSSKSTAGTPEWMAPEVLRNERSNEKCDIYSFGVILWELTTSHVPWSGLNPMQVVGAVGFQNRRLDIPEDVDPVVAQIIRDCWENDPQLRPTFSQLIHRLKRVPNLYFRRTDSTSRVTE